LRILLSATAYPPSIGGAQEYAHQLLKQLLLAGHEVSAFCQWDENRSDWLLGTTLSAPRSTKQYLLDGVSVTRIGVPARRRWEFLPWLPFNFVSQRLGGGRIAATLLSEIRPHVQRADVVHNVRIGRAGISIASQRLAQEWGVPFVLTPVHHARWSRWIHREYRDLYRTADLVIALTPTEGEMLQDLDVPASRQIISGTGPVVAEESFPDRFRSEHGVAGPMVLFLGQKYHYKNFDLILEAAPEVWRTCPDAHFMFIGPRTPYSVRRFRSVRHPNIHELGSVPLQDKTDALAACDILCVPSGQESFGAVFLEAWMFEKPVIGGPAPALRDVISEGVDGHLVQAEPHQLAQRIVALLKNPSLRGEMGKRGREKVLSRFVWPKLAEKTQAAYAEAIASYRGRKPGQGANRPA